MSYKATWLSWETGVFCENTGFETKEEALKWAMENLIDPEPSTLHIEEEKNNAR